MKLSEILVFSKLRQYRRNYQLMRRAVNEVGKEYERKAYEDLLRPAEEGSTSKVVEGHALYFSAEAFSRKQNGDIGFCVDADGLPTLGGIKPSYHFWRRKDGSNYY